MEMACNLSVRSIFSINFARLSLSIFAAFVGAVAAFSVFLNDIYFWAQSQYYINLYLFFLALLLGASRKSWGLMVFIFLLPLSAGFGSQLNAYIGSVFLILPNAGLDLASGFFLGSLAAGFQSSFRNPEKLSAPWPIALVIVVVTISTAIAILRNIYQSAAASSFKGLLFNLVHFRPIGWHDDFMPIADWIAYALAVAIVISIIGSLKDLDNKNQIIFRSLMAGIVASSLMGILQALTGLGLPENLLSFRKDLLGSAVVGFQPDLHAFAGHMLLGAVGLWGYFYSGISRLEKKIVALVIIFSWTGLILSKSRAILLFALLAIFIWILWCSWRDKRQFFLAIVVISSIAIGSSLFLIVNFSNSLNGFPILSWLADLVNEFKNRDLTSWSLLSGVFGARFEIWEGAFRMWSHFPMMGIGQGNFYRLSDVASFSRSNFLILNHGENAHNYFLQTLTETGIIGVIVFLMALITPIYVAKDKKALIPAVIAIVSLFLGNIFSHSFLVRENLLIFSVVIGLLYSAALPKLVKTSREFIKIAYKHILFRWICIASITVAVASGALEVFKSFGKFPFEYGLACFSDESRWADGWVGGMYSLQLPKGAAGIRVSIDNYLPGEKNLKDPLQVQFIGDNGLKILVSIIEISRQRPLVATMLLPKERQNNAFLNTVSFKLSRCSSPRNVGLSLDSRRLGFHMVRPVEVIYE